MHSTCQQAGSQAAAAAIALQPQHRSHYDCNQWLDQPVNASNVAMLQVTGKLDGADSGLDISVNELDQHLHKVLEVREPPDCLPAQQQSHMRPAMGCCVQRITCIDVCSRCLLNLVTSKGDSSAWVWSWSFYVRCFCLVLRGGCWPLCILIDSPAAGGTCCASVHAIRALSGHQQYQQLPVMSFNQPMYDLFDWTRRV